MQAGLVSSLTRLMIVYFSSVSGNTHRFVQKISDEVVRIPISGEITVDEDYVLILPTYGTKSGVPPQVVKFLNDEQNRSHITGVIAAGNTNFGTDYGKAGMVVAEKCNVPLLYRFEIFGTPEDVLAVSKLLML